MKKMIFGFVITELLQVQRIQELKKLLLPYGR